MSINLGVTARLGIIKNLLALFLITTVGFTWSLWSGDRAYPYFPGAAAFDSVNGFVAHALPFVLIICLLLTLALRQPRIFILVALIAGAALLLLDGGRLHYWFYFYLLLLAILLGYNWRVDNAGHYYAIFNALKIVVALVYVLSAVQHFGADFRQREWMAFIRPFERFWTPEQCAYGARLAYVIPYIELFIVVGLFLSPAKITAICFAVLFHLFTIVVQCMQPMPEPALIIWNIFMIALLFALFAGNPAGQKQNGFAFSFYVLAALLLLAGMAPTWYLTHKRPLENKIGLMQGDAHNQYIYITEEGKNKLPLYVQSFALQRENGYHRLCITSWSLHELSTRQVLSPDYLLRFTACLNRQFGTDAVVSILSAGESKQAIALK
jgi:hypothetical protein